MIIAITEFFHDKHPTNYFVDTEKLNESNYIEAQILKESKKNSKILQVHIDASEWDEQPEKFGIDPRLNESLKIDMPDKIDKVMQLHIVFDV